MTKISGWARYPVFETEILTPRTREALRDAITCGEGAIARGNGRSYGDAGIGAGRTLWMGAFDRIRAFDATTGRLTVEAGVLLSDLIGTFGPRGFFPAVVPGTKHITVGGAIAADIHGKNHHCEGGFGNHVESLILATANGDFVFATPSQNSELFFATVGGMGLTGIIIEATFQLRSIETGWIKQTTLVARDIEATVEALNRADSARYSAAWIDCLAKGAELGRSLVLVGEHARCDELSDRTAGNPYPCVSARGVSVPFDLPDFVLNPWIVRAFNELYFRLGAHRAGEASLLPIDAFFFPLDGVGDWNRLYGRRGFVQHQCVVPVESGASVLAEILGRVAARGDAFLAVLKKLGPSNGVLSFPAPGYTLALDFPMRPGLLQFLDELDRIVANAGGRIYLAKDACQSGAVFEAGYPGLQRFREIKKSVDPTRRIRSRLSERLGI